jgi:hypothetical protein
MELPQVDMLLKHYFSNGVYTRELHIPKGTMILGKIHRYECINIISKGKIAIYDNETDYTILEAPHTFISDAGVSKLGISLEDTIWINCFATNELDPEKIVEDMTVPFEIIQTLIEDN